MKMRVLAAASIVLTVVLVAAISHASPSCCDPKNSSAPGAMFAPGQPTQGAIPAASPQQRVVTPQITPAMIRATGSNWGGPVPQGQYAAPKPVGLPNVPAAPSCCAGPNNSGPARGINPATQAQFRGCGGCGGCGGTGGQASYSGFQPASGRVLSASNPPNSGQQVSPVPQAPCCSTTGPGSNQRGWNASQPTVFPVLW
jgi:hypothetical protein